MTGYVDVAFEDFSDWLDSDGRTIFEKDFKVGGEVWRVHLSDADPYPSKPHAHYIAGYERFFGCTLHLGSAQLYRGREPMDRFLGKRPFATLIERIRPKFPGVILPIPSDVEGLRE